jgi:acetyl esterase/lipase
MNLLALPGKHLAVVASLLVGTTPFLWGADADKSDTPKPIPLWPKGAPGAKGTEDKDVPTVTVYLPAKQKATGVAIVVCPGGGYGGLASGYEGHDVARWLNTVGAAGIVLKYRHAPTYGHPYPLLDAQRALRFTRAHAKKWNVDPRRVGILGFSAGGHLASTAGTHFNTHFDEKKSSAKKDRPDLIDLESCRPDFMVLIYPVISFTAPFAHEGSRINLIGKDAAPDLAKSLSSELQVTARTPPAFLVHTTGDTGVPPENSVAFYLALRKAKVPCEIHIFEKGQHGLGLGPKGSSFSSWPGLCAQWLELRKNGK